MPNSHYRLAHPGTIGSLAMALLLTGWLGLTGWLNLPTEVCQGQTAPARRAQAATPTKYRELPVDESLRDERTAVGRIRSNPNPSSNDLTTLERYYQTYALPRWTLAENRQEIMAYRRELRNDFRRIRSPQVYDRVNKLVLSFMTNVAKGDFHPAARFNAILTIGNLNVREPARTSDKPVPPTEALRVLLQAFSDANQIDAVRVGALLGIVRHAMLGITDGQLRDEQVSPAMIALAKTDDPPPGRSAQGHTWVRVLAINALSMLGQPGPQGEVALALADIVATDTTPMLVRCAAARALGKLSYQDPGSLDADQFTLKLAQLASAVCSDEVTILEQQKREENNASEQGSNSSYGGMYSSGMGMGMGMGMEMEMGEETDEEENMDEMYGGGGMGMGGIIPSDEEEDTMETRRIRGSCRRLKSRMGCVITGLQGELDPRRTGGQLAGVKALAQTQQQTDIIQQLYTAIDNLFTELDARKDHELDSDMLDAAIQTAADLCNQVLAGAGGGAPQAQPSAVETAATKKASS